MNLAILRSELRSYLRSRDDQQPFSDAELDLFINAALREIAERTDVLVKEHAAEVLPGTGAISLPGGLIGVQIVRWNGIALTETTQEFLDSLDHHWITKVGTPERYYTNTPNVVRLVPIPDGCGVVRVRYTATPSVLDEDFDVPDIPAFLASLAPLFAAHRAFVALGDMSQAQNWLLTFERRLDEAKTALARRTSVPKGIRIRTEVRRR